VDGVHGEATGRHNRIVAVRDDDLIDATQEGAPVFGDTREGDDDDDDGAFASGPAPLRAPPTPQAAATVVARLDDIAGAGGISFLASQLDESDEGDDDASAFEAGATSPDLGALRPAAPAPGPPTPTAPAFAPPMRARPPMAAPTSTPPTPPPSLPGQPPPTAWPDDHDDAPATTTRPPSSLPPPPPSSRVFPGAREPTSPPVTTSPSLSRRAAPAAALDPPLPPTTSSGPSLPRPKPTAGLDPPVAPPPKARRPRRHDDRPPPAAELVVVTPAIAGSGGGGGRLGLVVLGVAVALLVGTLAMRDRGGLVGGAVDPAVAQQLSERARATLAPRLRSDLVAPVAGVARSVGAGDVVVVKDRVGDAWLLPDGVLVVTDGLLRRLASDAQLAAVIAHLVAHRQLGHMGTLAADLDGPAVLAVATAPLGVDERAADARAVELLAKGGWRARALVDAEDALAAGPWAGRHRRAPGALLEVIGPSTTGREDKDWYEREVRAVVGAP
jgi:hypothetical protein